MFIRTHKPDVIKTTLYAAVILSSLFVVVVLASAYGDFLATRVAPGLPFQITRVGTSDTPTLVINENNEIEWDTRPENIRLYPAELISLCPSNAVSLTPDCETLDFHTENDGLTSVFIPPTFTPGDYNLIFTAWSQDNRIVFNVNNTIQVSLTSTPPETETVTVNDTVNQQTDPDNTVNEPTPSDQSEQPTVSPQPTTSPNTFLQLIIENEQPVTEDTIQYTLSNVEPDEVECLSLTVNNRPVPLNGQSTSTCN